MSSCAAAAVAAALTATDARATWSIIVTDTRTGEVVMATATCLTNQDMVPLTPVILTGVGACTAQSFVETSGQNRSLVRNMMLAGAAPASIVASLTTFDAGHQSRQYGIADTIGRAATFSGRNNGPFAGGVTGQVGELTYAVQGNVITGPCVLDAAVAALASTPGSVGDKVMAAMEAVRLVGGDGRCSCNPDQADECGCPPPGSPGVKSAHVGVMIISRAGDEDRCNAVIRTGASPSGLIAADADGDGYPELLSVNTGANNVTLIRNATRAGLPLPAMLVAQTASVGATPRSGATADFTGDGVMDALVINGAAATVSLLRGSLGGGAFQFTLPAVSVATVGASPQKGVVGDFDADGRPDFVLTSQTGNGVWILRNHSAPGVPAFVATLAADLGAGASPVGIVAGEFGGSAAGVDLAVATSGRAALAFLIGNGNGTFAREADLALPGRPTWLDAADLDGDGDTDLAAVTTSPTRVLAMYRDAAEPTGWAIVNLPVVVGAARVTIGDFDGDGRPDLATISGASLTTYRNLGARSFATSTITLPTAATDVLAADFDADGRDDLATTASGLNQSVLVLKSYAGGVFDGRAGCANGSYYFSSNVAFAQAADPDPVIQLAQQYALFRASKVGVPDAVRSTATLDRPCLFAGGADATALVLDVRDLNGDPVAIEPGAVHAEHAPGSAGLATIGVPMSRDGTVIVPISPGASVGIDRLSVRIAHPGSPRPIVLMPAPAIRTVLSPDFDHDGDLTPADFAAYVECYFAQPPCPRADYNGDGAIDADDLGDFINATFNPCG